MLTVDFAIQAIQALSIKERKELEIWFAKQQVGNLPKKKRKAYTSNVPSLEETRHIVHKAHGWI